MGIIDFNPEENMVRDQKSKQVVPLLHQDDLELDKRDIFDTLRNDRRRQLIEILGEDPNNMISVRELSTRIAEDESNESPPPRNIRNSVYVSLHQTHLPKLDQLGIVEYDSETKMAQIGEVHSEIARYTPPLTCVSLIDLPTNPGLYILLVTGVTALVLAGIILDLPLINRIDVGMLTAIYLAVIGVMGYWSFKENTQEE